MLSTQNVLPNFLKALVIASAALLSINAFAEKHESGELKDITVEETTILNGDSVEEAKEKADTEEKKRMEDELEKIPTE